LIPLTHREYIPPVSEPVRKRLVLSQTDLPPVDPKETDRERTWQILRAFADRAYRRPATQEELARLLGLVESATENTRGSEQGIRLALRAILVSPHFLFRREASVEPAGRDTDPFVLASRLSYFLWSSMPD
jgi:hypothetical protein